MLQSIRDKAQGWIAWVIVILISIPFALFGIQEYLGSSADPVVAEVEGVDIKESELERGIRDFREQMRATLGAAYRQEMFEGDAFRKQMLDRLVEQRLLQKTANDWNMRSSDAQVSAYIRSIPAFQNDGHFDQRFYEAAVRNRGLSNAGFEDLVRHDLVMLQMQGGVQNSGFATDSLAAEQARLSGQRRNISFLRIPMAGFNDVDQVSDEDAQAYYQAHPDSYRVPERVKLAYIRLNSDVLAPLVETDEEKLREFFEEHRDQFIAAEERRVRHILVGADAGDDAAQKAKATSLLEQLRGGADFAELARENSNDPGSAANGGDLGWVNRGVMVKPFENSAFSLQLNTLSEPVKTTFGYHIIEVTEKRGGSDATFEEMRDEVETAYRKQEAEELYYNQFERLADAAYETPDSLEPAADILALKVEKTGWVNRGAPLPSGIDSPKAANAAFSEDVLGRGHNSDVIELGPTDAVVLRVIEHEPATVKPFEQVREQVLAQAAAEQASEKAAEKGREIIGQLRSGANLAAIAAEKGWQQRDEEIGRQQRDVPAEVIQATFDEPPPAEGMKQFTGVVSAEGDYIVIAVNSVQDGDPGKADDPSETIRRNKMYTELGRAEFNGVVSALRERANVVFHSE